MELTDEQIIIQNEYIKSHNIYVREVIDSFYPESKNALIAKENYEKAKTNYYSVFGKN